MVLLTFGHRNLLCCCKLLACSCCSCTRLIEAALSFLDFNKFVRVGRNVVTTRTVAAIEFTSLFSSGRHRYVRLLCGLCHNLHDWQPARTCFLINWPAQNKTDDIEDSRLFRTCSLLLPAVECSHSDISAALTSLIKSGRQVTAG